MAKAKFHPANAAADKGWVIVKYTLNEEGEAVTFCSIPGHHPFVVHRFSQIDGGFYHGEYYLTYSEANVAYNRRRQLHFVTAGRA